MGSARRSGNRHRLIQNRATPTRRPQSPSPQTPGHSRVQRLNGLFANGTWYCNCTPRDQAKILPVTKDSPNHGRLFWTCSKPPPPKDPAKVKDDDKGKYQCSFFMWEDDPRARNGGHGDALPTAGIDAPAPPPPPARAPAGGQPITTRPVAAQIPTPSTRASTAKKAKSKFISDFFKSTTAGRQGQVEAHGNAEDPAAGLPPSSSSDTMVPETPSAGTKRKRAETDDDEDLIGDMSSDEEKLMEEAMESSTRKLQVHAAVPAAAATTTPSAPRMDAASGEQTTPDTARMLFPEARRVRFDGAGAAAATTGSDSPALGASPRSGDDAGGIVDEVMGLLKGQPLEESVRAAVERALDRQAARLRGAVKGRDAVRAHVKVKDERIAQLQERVVALENKSKMQRQELTEIKAGLANLYSRH